MGSQSSTTGPWPMSMWTHTLAHTHIYTWGLNLPLIDLWQWPALQCGGSERSGALCCEDTVCRRMQLTRSPSISRWLAAVNPQIIYSRRHALHTSLLLQVAHLPASELHLSVGSTYFLTLVGSIHAGMFGFIGSGFQISVSVICCSTTIQNISVTLTSRDAPLRPAGSVSTPDKANRTTAVCPITIKCLFYRTATNDRN